MFLVKCKCGCLFILKENDLKDFLLPCPNCKSKIALNTYTSLAESQQLSEQVESVNYIPDNAKITVTFDA